MTLPRVLRSGCRVLAGALLLFAPGPLRPLAPEPPQTPADPRTEWEIKAYFLINFARFVEWPPEAQRGAPTGQLAIGVLGRDPFGGALDDHQGELVKGRAIVVRRARSVQDLQGCTVVFTTQTGEELTRTLEALKGRSVLTFGESEDFLKQGGMVRFVLVDKKVQMQVNRRATQEARLVISSRLLAITTVVNP